MTQHGANARGERTRSHKVIEVRAKYVFRVRTCPPERPPHGAPTARRMARRPAYRFALHFKMTLIWNSVSLSKWHSRKSIPFSTVLPARASSSSRPACSPSSLQEMSSKPSDGLRSTYWHKTSAVSVPSELQLTLSSRKVVFPQMPRKKSRPPPSLKRFRRTLSECRVVLPRSARPSCLAPAAAILLSRRSTSSRTELLTSFAMARAPASDIALCERSNLVRDLFPRRYLHIIRALASPINEPWSESEVREGT
mmetsp:Transcript_30876/g.80778  ORF Transcript_30876/g.80778 Transcript_30876/m.80778 type:complete len:253 (+) Transcript_30876:287-1045(+)